MLFHQCNRDRHAWDSLANDLAAAGFHVLTFDYRGFGESGGRGRNEPQKVATDGDAVYAYLLSQKEVDHRVAVGGASCGVIQSSNFAVRHQEVRALLLLSGTAIASAKAYVAATPSLPIFGAATERDADAAKGIREVVGASKNPQSTLRIFAGAEHGVDMFIRNPGLRPEIVRWLQAQLVTNDQGRK